MGREEQWGGSVCVDASMAAGVSRGRDAAAAAEWRPHLARTLGANAELVVNVERATRRISAPFAGTRADHPNRKVWEGGSSF